MKPNKIDPELIKSLNEGTFKMKSQEREGIEQLIERYKDELSKSINTTSNKDCYRTFISELEKLLKLEL